MSFRFQHDTRGVSSVVGYITNLALLVLIVSSVALVGTGQFETARHQQASAEFEGMGQQVALQFQIIDQLDRAGADPSSSITRTASYPESIVGVEYRVGVEERPPDGDVYNRYYLVIDGQEDVDVRVPFESVTLIETGKYVDGGEFLVTRPQSTQQNIDSGLCKPYNSNGNDYNTSDSNSIESIDEAQGNDYEPDKCKITLKETGEQ